MNPDETFKHEILMPGRTVRDGLVYVGEQRIVDAGAPINPIEWVPGEAVPKKKIVLQRVWSCCGSPHEFHLSGCVHEKCCVPTGGKPGDRWVIGRRDAPFMRGVLQPCVLRDGQYIPVGPSAATVEELRWKLWVMMKACDEPIHEGVDR